MLNPQIFDIQVPPSRPQNHPAALPQTRKRVEVEQDSSQAGPSIYGEVIDLTGIEREGFPLRVMFAWGDAVYLTLESDSD